MTKKTTHTITISGEQFNYSLTTNDNNSTCLICREARLNQNFLNEDIPEAIQLLSEHIKNARKFIEKQNPVIRLRALASS